MAGELEQPRDRVAVRAVARVRDRERAGRVRRHHLHLDALRRRGAAAAVRVPGLEDRAERGREPVVGEEEVDEARPRDLRALDRGERLGELGELGGELARRPPPRPGELQRRVRREVAVLDVARPLQLDVGAERLGELA